MELSRLCCYLHSLLNYVRVISGFAQRQIRWRQDDIEKGELGGRRWGRSRSSLMHCDIFIVRVRKTTEFSIDEADVQGEMN
jgi:hypothetical protein